MERLFLSDERCRTEGREENSMIQERKYKYDNLRFTLMFLVVFGHFLALQDEYSLYRFIYSFHMPAFIFISGYFAKYSRRKILEVFLYPYFLFQILYELFDVYILRTGNQLEIQFTTPYWLLWYLLLLVFYYLLIPFFRDQRTWVRVAVMAGVLLLSIVADFDSSIGDYLQVSRLFTFLPYFVLGYYAGHPEEKRPAIPEFVHSWWIKLGVVLVLGGCELIVKRNPRITPVVLYGEQPYRVADYGPLIKILLLVTAISWIAFLLLCVPEKKIPIVSYLGRYTLPVYLLHGFAVMLAEKYFVFSCGELGNLMLTAVISFLLMVVLGNSYAAALFERVFTGKWIGRLAQRCRNLFYRG